MNLAIWIVQGLLAVMMAGAGLFKLVTPHAQLVTKMPWARSWPEPRIKLLGAAEALGAAGLILPGLLHLLPILTPVAAIALVILMAGAVKTHLDRKESPAPALVPLLLASVVVLGRLVLVPWV
ncbi:MAG: DoxX family protein [Proteobacteria bacterium]|nr:DoxX family protein [Pseudomonadota bacterium]